MTTVQQIGAELIGALEEKRGSKVVVYFTGDRFPIGSMIAEDAVRPLYEHLLNLDLDGNRRVIDLFLYSRGGDVSVPWRIASMLREFSDEFNILVPYRAQSAATLLCLGADDVVMARKAELGPIDPTLTKATIGEGPLHRQAVSVEDVNSFLSFIRERANINDQAALAQVVENLIDEIGSLTLGTVNRENSHIRLVARKLLASRREKMDQEKIDTIIETLTEKMYSHGHGIGRTEARDIGLHVTFTDEDLESLIWQLYVKYEDFLELKEPISPEIELEDADTKILEDVSIAVIESAKKLHIFRTMVELRKERSIPTSLQININAPLQLPPGMQPSQIPQEVQQILEQLVSQLSHLIPQMVHEEIVRQSPVTGIGGRVYGGKWYEEN